MRSCHEWQSILARQRDMAQLFASLAWNDLASRRVLDVGCRDGGILLDLLRLGFSPRNLVGIESSPDRFAQAMQVLPSGVILMQGDASTLDLPAESEDVVIQSEVFSLMLGAPFQWRLAQAMWRWVAPGGGVLWYDLATGGDSVSRAVPRARIAELFPLGRITARRVTLATGIARAACAVHCSLHPLLGSIPFLRSHILAWIEKPAR